ncbi:MAG: putative sporulation protein YtxC [Solirubrobacterales bacterium]
MHLVTLAFEKERDNVIREISTLRELYRDYNVDIGFSESMAGKTHFVRVFCDDNMESRLLKKADFYMADILYKIAANEFINNEMEPMLEDSYFFLKNDEIGELKCECKNILMTSEKHLTDSNIYCYNKKNIIVEKIKKLIRENREINIEGFITFRMKELNSDFAYIVNRIVEGYMVEREYEEFIKLLKYFVDMQEPKVNLVNIIIDEMGDYKYRDGKNKDIKKSLYNEIYDLNEEDSDGDDMLISLLIANSPKRIVIHKVENAINEEIIDTIVKVFSGRVELCNNCRLCGSIKEL